MKRFWGHLVAVTALAAGAGSLFPACADNRSSLFIFGVMAPPANTTGGKCSYLNDPAQPTLNEGTLDGAFRQTYDAIILIGSELISRANQDIPRTETSRITLEGASVRVTDSAGNELSSFTRLGAGLIEASKGSTASYGILGATLVDPKTVTSILATLEPGGSRRVVAYVKAFGHTLGGAAVETGEFQFPVNVCYGCLVTFPSDSNDPTKQALDKFNRRNCQGGTSTSTTAKIACAPGQDESIDCRTCEGRSPVCDPLYPNAPAVYPEPSSTTPIADAGTGG